MSKKFSFKTMMIFAGSYVATVIGSGYATGQEILQFFSVYGLSGFLAGTVSMVLFSVLGAEVLYRGTVTKPKDSMKIFTFYTGKLIGTFLDYFVPLFLFAVLVIMISGAGSTLTEYYGMPNYVGRVGLAILAYFTVSLGLKRLADIIGYIGPVIIVFTILLSIFSILRNIDNLQVALEALNAADVGKPAPNAFISGILYASYNVIMVVAFLAGLGSTTDDTRVSKAGGILGGISLMIAAILMYFAILCQFNILQGKTIPTLFLADQISPTLAILFSIILLLGIFSTAVPLLWQCTNRFVNDDHPKFKIISLGIAALALIGGFLPFDKLVSTVYPFTGWLGIFVLMLIGYKSFKLKKENRTGADEVHKLERQ
ncbi:YkvI family membrane protein [Peptostreptococcus faecalis]|uniref:YkvI family membrane protein n=1 Tax=Peptostreptococcus faecalis TaxID=2045015 RepID=UPI000C79A363|nr:hypothetical protein [Peptostreptococcus faecalis]